MNPKPTSKWRARGRLFFNLLTANGKTRCSQNTAIIFSPQANVKIKAGGPKERKRWREQNV